MYFNGRDRSTLYCVESTMLNYRGGDTVKGGRGTRVSEGGRRL